MGIMVYSLLWVMQDFVHQPYLSKTFRLRSRDLRGISERGFRGIEECRVWAQGCRAQI